MTDADLLAAIAAAPDDDAPRLVYADWLAQKGDPRGEYITLSCRYAQLAAGDPHAAPLRARLDELRGAHAGGWLRTEPFVAYTGTLERGFVARVTIAGRQTKREALAAIAAREPVVRRLTVAPMEDSGFTVARALEDLPLVNVVELDLDDAVWEGRWIVDDENSMGHAIDPYRWLEPNYYGRDMLERLARLPRPLAALSLRRGLGPSLGALAGGAPAFASLRRLDLSGNELGGGGALAAWLRSPGVASLRELRLSGCKLLAADVDALVDGALGPLSLLDVRDNALDPGALARLRARFPDTTIQAS